MEKGRICTPRGFPRLGTIGVECDLCLAPAGDWGTESGGDLGSEPSLCLPTPMCPLASVALALPVCHLTPGTRVTRPSSLRTQS